MPSSRQGTPPAPATGDDAEIVERLRRGEEGAFASLIEMYGATMLRVAQIYVRDREAAKEVVQAAIESLPDSQREVIRLRDVEGWGPEEVADALEISDGNQRVLLHRARSKVRAAIESYLDPETPGAKR